MVSIDMVGNAITFLRKRAGFTQKDLANRLGISDKAVSKWERGLGLPDVSYLSKLSILLDTDTDSLLNGDVIHHDEQWNGFLFFEDDSIRADAMIYDKPLSDYLLSFFMLVGIKRIVIQSSTEDRAFFKREYGDGSKLGVELIFALFDEPASFPKDCTNIMTVYGKSFIYGVDQTRFFQRAMMNREGVVILSLPKESEDKQVRFDEFRKVTEKNSLNTQYNYYHIPVAFLPVSQFNNFVENGFRPKQEYYTELLDRGFVEIHIKNADDVVDASLFVKTVQKHCEIQIYCVEEIAWRRGLITLDQMKALAIEKENTPHGQYLLRIEARNRLE